MIICCQCGGEILFGEPHWMKVTENGVMRREPWCAVCIDDFSWACWNDEEWGPYRGRHHHLDKRGQ
jgi:hypothetical protein